MTAPTKAVKKIKFREEIKKFHEISEHAAIFEATVITQYKIKKIKNIEKKRELNRDEKVRLSRLETQLSILEEKSRTAEGGLI